MIALIFYRMQQHLTNWCLSKKIQQVGSLHDSLAPKSVEIDDNGLLKFIEQTVPVNIAIETNSGYALVKHTLKTVPYQVWHLVLENGLALDCADAHIVIQPGFKETFVKDLRVGDEVLTRQGMARVISCEITNVIDNMYDLELADERHLYYTNDILSHNTQTVSMYLLHRALFRPHQKILLASKNNSHAMSILSRIRFSVESLPVWLREDVIEWNKHSITFANGSSIISEATTEKTGRGLSISALYLDELAWISARTTEGLWRSLSPTLSTGGDLIISSTPNGDTDLFSTLWRKANQAKIAREASEKAGLPIQEDVEFYPLYYPWDSVPGRGEEYLKRMRSELGPIGFAQEISCLSYNSSVNTSIGDLTMKELWDLMRHE